MTPDINAITAKYREQDEERVIRHQAELARLQEVGRKAHAALTAPEGRICIPLTAWGKVSLLLCALFIGMVLGGGL